MKKIAVGLSGGVDSAVAAALLTKEYEVYGVTLRMQGDCFDYEHAAAGGGDAAEETGRADRYAGEDAAGNTGADPTGNTAAGQVGNTGADPAGNAAVGQAGNTGADPAGNASSVSAWTVNDVEDAAAVAEKLGIHHAVVDCSMEFAGVKRYFCDEYLRGRTPNPCVLCNPTVKWKALLDYADSIGAEYVATGHYAGIERLDNGRYAMRATDTRKDQTYVLYGLTQEQLARTIMPLGAYGKEQVREIAAGLGLTVADKPDSMEICFVPDGDYTGFIGEYTGITKPEGNFVDEEGRVLGRHRGITHYTIGQRKGLGVAFGVPLYVKEIRPQSDEVVLSPEDIYTDRVRFGDVKYMGAAKLCVGEEYFAKVRYSHMARKCSIIGIGQCGSAEEVMLAFDPPVRAATPGQSAVLYDEHGRVMCGGIIRQ